MDMYTRPLGRLATEGYLARNPDSDVQSLSQFHVGKWVTPRTHTHTDLQIYIYCETTKYPSLCPVPFAGPSNMLPYTAAGLG